MFTDRLIPFVLLLLLALSCAERLDTPESAEGGLVPVQLAFSLQKGTTSTKAMAGTITELGDSQSFRGMDSIWILSFGVPRTVRLSDAPLYSARSLPSISDSQDAVAYYSNGSYHKGLIANCNAHLYPDVSVSVPQGTASVLVYGQAPRRTVSDQATVQQIKHRYGSLVADGLYTVSSTGTAEDIHFRPDPISSASSVNSVSSAMATILNKLVKSSYTPAGSSSSVAWRNSTDLTLKSLFEWFTGGGDVMPGSGRQVLYMLNDLYTALNQYSSDDPEAIGLKQAILSNFNALVHTDRLLNYDEDPQEFSYADPDILYYPASLGLPEGSALLLWDQKSNNFSPVREQDFDFLAPMGRFCYMPSLYYFVNTTVKTDNSREIYKAYSSEKSWSQILSSYTLGTEVDHSTHAIALVDPLQFACSKCVLTVRAKTETLLDRKGVSCSATGSNFPVVGMIIASQYSQDFAFSPDVTSEEYSMYDNDFYVAGSDTTFLKYYATGKGPALQSLVLPTPVGQDVYFCLELRNDSGVAFTGAEGLVLPGNCFYLIGKLDLTGKIPNQAFIQDSYTTIDCVVESLEYAHICVPELRVPQMNLGVHTEDFWIMSQPTQVPLR
jgi:hypothetical protein